MNKKTYLKLGNILCLLYLLFRVLDLITTFVGLNLGGTEVNPFVVWIMNNGILSIILVSVISVMVIFLLNYLIYIHLEQKFYKYLIIGLISINIVHLIIIINNIYTIMVLLR